MLFELPPREDHERLLRLCAGYLPKGRCEMSDEDWKAYESDCLDARVFLRDAMKAGWTLTPSVTPKILGAVQDEIVNSRSFWCIRSFSARENVVRDAVARIIALARGGEK